MSLLLRYDLLVFLAMSVSESDSMSNYSGMISYLCSKLKALDLPFEPSCSEQRNRKDIVYNLSIHATTELLRAGIVAHTLRVRPHQARFK